MYIYICVYIYIYMCVYIYIYIYIYTYTYIYIYTYIFIPIYIYIHTYILIYIYNVIYVSVYGIGTGMVVSACLIILWHVPFLCFRWLTCRMILRNQENLLSKVLPIPAVHDAFSFYEPCYAMEKQQQQQRRRRRRRRQQQQQHQQQHGLCSQFLRGSESSENYQPIFSVWDLELSTT